MFQQNTFSGILLILAVYIKFNAAEQCGTTLSCRLVTKTFTKTNLPHGYVKIATIPSGAYNITINKLKDSINFLALKTAGDDRYIINGHRGRSKIGHHKAAGVIFDYFRDDFTNSEWIRTRNEFTLKAVDFMLFVKDVNHGVKYEYYLTTGELPQIVSENPPSSISSDQRSIETEMLNDFSDDNKIDEVQEVNVITRTKKKKFMWKLIGFGECNKTCGGGYQPPVFRCIREIPTRFYNPKRCASLETPIFNEKIYECNTQLCPPYWHLGQWQECRSCQNGGSGTQERLVRCVQDFGSGVITQVEIWSCQSDSKPEEKQSCECPKQQQLTTTRRKQTKADKPSQLPLRGKQSVTTLSNNTAPRRVNMLEMGDKTGVWLFSNWNEQCSTECGKGVEYRSIFCDRTAPRTERCDQRVTPDMTKTCESETSCEVGEWFVGRWGICGGDCFNLVKRRLVYCIRNGEILDDEDCGEEDKRPETEKPCSLDEVKHCKPRWHYSEWTECSKTCDGGTQKRYVKCLEHDQHENVLRESQNCKFSDREPSYGVCNTEKCPEITVHPRLDLVQNELIPSCVDEFPNCHLVIKARLCSLEYYQRNCCYSCSGF